MSSYGSATPPGRTLRDRAFPTRPLLPTGIDVPLDVPGLAVPPPVSAAAKLADDLARTLGMVGDTFEAQARAREVERRRQAIEDAAAKELDEGHANERFDRWAPGVLARITDRTRKDRIVPAGDDASIGQQADELIEAETRGAPAAFQAKFRERAVGFLSRELQKSRLTIQDEALAQNLGLLSSNLDEPGVTPDRIAEMVATGRRLAPGLSDADLYGKVIVPAMARAADRGDTARAGMLAAALPPEFATERQTAELEAASRDRTRRNVRFDDARTLVQSDLDRVLLGTGTHEQASQRIIALEQQGIVDRDGADRLRADVVQHKASLLSSNARKTDEAAYDATFRGAVEQFGRAMDQGATTGGAGALPDSIDVVYPSGKEGRSVKRAEVVQAVIQDRFTGFDRQAAQERARLMGLGVPDGQATQQATRENLRRKFDFLQSQGGSKDAVYEPWQSDLNGAVHQASVSGVEGALSPSVERAVTLMEQAEAMGAHGFIQTHLTDENSRAFLRSVLATRRTFRGDQGASGSAVSVQQAVGAVSRAVAGAAFGRSGDRTVGTRAIDTAITDLPGRLGNAENVEDVRRSIQEKADGYKTILSVPDAVAAARALHDVSQDFTAIDGRAVYTAGRQVPANINDLIGDLKTMYVAEHGAQERFGVGDLRGYLGDRDGILRLRNDNITVPESPALTLDDLHALNAWEGGIAAARQRAESARESAAQRARARQLETVPVPTGGRFRDTSPLVIRQGPRDPGITPAEVAAVESAIQRALAIPRGASPGLAAFMRYRIDRKAPGRIDALPPPSSGIPVYSGGSPI